MWKIWPEKKLNEIYNFFCEAFTVRAGNDYGYPQLATLEY